MWRITSEKPDYARALGLPDMQVVNYSDGYARVWRDSRGRVTRHLCVRASGGFDRCYRYEGGQRIQVTYEEWDEAERAARAPKTRATKKRERLLVNIKQRGDNALHVDENDRNID